ncbi:MAG: Jag N-terminal domain-containing protein [Campylobacterota bacterium]
MLKIESKTLEIAYSEAAQKLECSVTELQVEIVQHPSKGLLGLFAKSAIIVALRKNNLEDNAEPVAEKAVEPKPEPVSEAENAVEEAAEKIDDPASYESDIPQQRTLNDTILPTSFVTDQDDEDEQNDYIEDAIEGMFDDEEEEAFDDVEAIAAEVKTQINTLFSKICFELNEIDVTVYDENTLMLDFNGNDAALLIGKEGYRYKALSYMIFNWINAKYGLQLRLEIAEFLKNQEESITRYLVGVCESIERDGRAQTKILDGVLVQIALKQLRDQYPDKYVAIRSTRDGAKFIIVNGYNSY